ITRRPAQAIIAFGSLKIISPTGAKLAGTHRVVACGNYVLYNSTASKCRYKDTQGISKCIK
ncbi:hypothetical protein, partial [Staphylococcus aureus]